MPQETTIGRHPLEAKAVGVLQNGKRKITGNIFSILWSDHNEIVIYRTFEEFKKMHQELRKKFPLESGILRKSEKMIPKLRDVPIFRKNRRSSRFIERLRLLERFSQDLLKTDNKISQSNVVIMFFTPTNSDLNPTFPENSLVIMPSEARELQTREQPKQLPQPPVCEPIVSQMYFCLEDYETKDTKNRPFKVKRNEHLGVLIKESSGWWLVENEEKRLAWFPAPFLKTVEEKQDTDSDTESEDEGVRYYATTSYDAMSRDELSISRGVLVEVMEKSNNGWWLIRYNGKSGYVPAMYLKLYRNCHQLEAMKQGNLSSMGNLFKASSTLELSRREEPWRKDNHSALNNDEKASLDKLDRRKSRSISDIPVNTQYGFQHPPTALIPRQIAGAAILSSGAEMTSKVYKAEDIRDSPLASSHPVVKEPPTPRPRKISIETLAMESTPKSHVDSEITPRVPQRPRQHEILSKCTSATRTAIRKRQGAVMYS